jgi:hypothetical protein
MVELSRCGKREGEGTRQHTAFQPADGKPRLALLELYRHPVRQLLLHVVRLLNQRAEAGRTARFIKVRAHRGEPPMKQPTPWLRGQVSLTQPSPQ